MSQAPTNNKDKAKANYKNCRDRVMSMLYSLMNTPGGLFQNEALNKVASGFDIEDMSPEDQKIIEGVVTELAWNLISAEEELNDSNKFW